MNKAVELVARAMIDSYNDTSDKHLRQLTFKEIINDPRHGVIESAKAAIGALRNLPTETFESSEQMLHFIRVIDNIGLAITTGK